MHPDLLELLACPSCRSDLEVEDGAIDTVDGFLICTSCHGRYPVRDGIPRFNCSQQGADSERVAAQFQVEFSSLSDGDRDMDPFELREFFFFTRTGLDPRIYEALPGDPYRTNLPENSYRPDGAALRDKLVLDAGCGPGRFTEVAAKRSPRLVVGLDLGDHVERAAERCAHLPNTAFVQGSVLTPPFKRGVFEVAFSIGVLHHTGSPEAGATAVAEAVASGGSVSLWVYPPEYWGWGPQKPIARFLHKLISKKEPQDALKFCDRWLYPLGKFQMKIHSRPILRYLLAPIFLIKVPRHPTREVMRATIFDYYGPVHISTHLPTEVVDWLCAAGFADARELPVRSSAHGRKTR